MPINARQKPIKVFHVEFQSELDDTTYQGTFTCKKLSISDRSRMGVVKAQLSGGLHYDPAKPGYGIDATTDDFNAVLAHLTVAITDAPDWWNLDEMSDVGIIYEVYKEVAEHEASFRKRPEADEGQDDRPAGKGNRSRKNRSTD